jgi:hypothetical protein
MMKKLRNFFLNIYGLKMKLNQVTVIAVIFAWSTGPSASMVSVNFSGEQFNVEGESINGEPVSVSEQEFAPLFQNGQTVNGSITFDTDQPDMDPDSNTGTYQIGALEVEIPELGLTASVSSNFMQISSFNEANNFPDDQFFASNDGVDSFSNDVGLPTPVSFFVLLFGDSSMLVDDNLPTSNLDWNFGNLSFSFIADDGSERQVFATFTPAAPVPVPAAVWLFGSGLLGLFGVPKRKHT